MECEEGVNVISTGAAEDAGCCRDTRTRELEDTLAAELEANRKEAKSVAKIRMSIMMRCIGILT